METTTRETAALCRLRIRPPEQAAIELAVPADVPLGDLMPAIVELARNDLADAEAEHGGWVLQRLGGEPLEEEETPDSLDLHDGAELFLRPRRRALPAVHYDDLPDGVTDSMARRADGWKPAITHHFSVGCAMLALVLGLILLALPGPGGVREAAAAVTALALVLGALSAARAIGDGGSAIALAMAAVPFATLAGALVPHGPAGAVSTGARLLGGGSAAAGATALAVAAVGCGVAVFLGLMSFALQVVLVGAVMLTGTPLDHAAAVCGVLAVAFGAFVPGLSFRLAGLRLPALPRSAEELQNDLEPFEADGVKQRSDMADGFLTAFYASVGGGCLCVLALLLTGHGWAPLAMAGALAVLLLLHARAIGSRWQRASLLVPGVLGITALLTRLVDWQREPGRLEVLGLLAGIAAVLMVVAWTVPGRRLLPYWGRAADVLQSAAAIALMPLAVDVLGVFHTLRLLG